MLSFFSNHYKLLKSQLQLAIGLEFNWHFKVFIHLQTYINTCAFAYVAKVFVFSLSLAVVSKYVSKYHIVIFDWVAVSRAQWLKFPPEMTRRKKSGILFWPR